MQTLYMVVQQGDMELSAAGKQLHQSIYNSYQAYLLNLQFLLWLSAQVEQEAAVKKNKYLPTEEDLNFTVRFCENRIVQYLRTSEAFRKAVQKELLQGMQDEEIIRGIYTQMKAYISYKKYVEKPESSAEEDKRFIFELYHGFLFKNEYFDDYMESCFGTWADDEFIVSGLLDECIEAIPPKESREHNLFTFRISEEEEEFAMTLLRKTLEEDKYYNSLIEPKLQHWELERVSLVDRLLMKMAVTEFLYLPTVPLKVTLNEYLDISKIYSTPRSREFINGVLDKVMNELKTEGKIVKTGRGLIE